MLFAPQCLSLLNNTTTVAHESTGRIRLLSTYETKQILLGKKIRDIFPKTGNEKSNVPKEIEQTEPIEFIN